MRLCPGILELFDAIALHVLAILVAIGAVFLNDFIGVLWVLGWKQDFSERLLKLQHGLICVAFLGAVGTGVAIALSTPEVIRHAGFWIKMALVAMIGVNGSFMGRKCRIVVGQRYKTLTTRTKVSLSLSVLLSLFLWVTTAFIGLFALAFDF